MAKEETVRRINRAIDSVRGCEGRLGHAFQAVIMTPERMSNSQLENLEAAIIRVAEILNERQEGRA